MPNLPISDLIRARYSCRSYKKTPIAPELVSELNAFIQTVQNGPFGTPLRFKLAAASDEDRGALQDLGTYGTIRNPAAFIIGAVGPGEKNMEDYGYAMETIILHATSLGIGTCWIGGFFTRSSFARFIQLEPEEILPAVTSAGMPANAKRSFDLFRLVAGSAARKPWEKLFFDQTFSMPLTQTAAGAFAAPLELLRLAPSASNKQPWRVVKDARGFHFFISRTPGYGKGSVTYKIGGLADLQRVDLGIALCHFELSAREMGLPGSWVCAPAQAPQHPQEMEYVATWSES